VRESREEKRKRGKSGMEIEKEIKRRLEGRKEGRLAEKKAVVCCWQWAAEM